MQNGEVSNAFLRTFAGLPFYMAHTKPKEDSSAVAFDRHFNPSLKHDSDYFRSVNKLLTCVEAHAGAADKDQEKVCASELKEVRLSAFQKQTMYHAVNQRFYMDYVSRAKGESPY